MSQQLAAPALAPARPARANTTTTARASRLLRASSGLAAAACAVTLAVLAASGEYYTPASDIGYYMGLAGGLMMLALLLYPLRKRMAFSRDGRR